MADEKKGGRKPDEGGKSGRSDKSRQPTRGRGKGPRRDGKPRRDDRGHGKQHGGRPPYQRRHGVRKTIKNGVGTVFIGQEDPFIYFPDSIRERQEQALPGEE